MTQHARISCINKTDRKSPHERIRYAGGVGGNGQRWKQDVATIIREIESREWAFYVNVGGTTAQVIVATHEGHKYIKTTADSTTKDNLLSLPECP